MNIKQLILDGVLAFRNKDKEYMQYVFLGVSHAMFPTSGRYIELYMYPDDFKCMIISEFNKHSQILTYNIHNMISITKNTFDGNDIVIHNNKNFIEAILPKQFVLDKEFHCDEFLKNYLIPTNIFKGKPSYYAYTSDRFIRESQEEFKEVHAEEILNNPEIYIG